MSIQGQQSTTPSPSLILPLEIYASPNYRNFELKAQSLSRFDSSSHRRSTFVSNDKRNNRSITLASVWNRDGDNNNRKYTKTVKSAARSSTKVNCNNNIIETTCDSKKLGTNEQKSNVSKSHHLKEKNDDTNKNTDNSANSNNSRVSCSPGGGVTEEIQLLVQTLKDTLNSHKKKEFHELNQFLELKIMQEAYGINSNNPYRKYFYNHVIPSLKQYASIINTNEEKIESFLQRQCRKIISKAFHTWRSDTIRFQRKHVYQLVENMDTSYYHNRKRSIFHVLSAISIGASSKKSILQRRRNAMADARNTLTLKLQQKLQTQQQEQHISNPPQFDSSDSTYPGGIITTDMLQGELRKIFHNEMHTWIRKRYFTICFHDWRKESREMKESKQLATRHYNRKNFHRTLNAWMTWLNDMLRYQEKMEMKPPRYDPKNIDNFVRKRLLTWAITSWKSKTQLSTIVKGMRRRIITKFVLNNFQAWFNVTKYHRKIKIDTITDWMNYYRINLLQNPFTQWHVYTQTIVNKRHDQQRFLCAYRKLRQRRIIYKLFRQWLHFTKYHRVMSLYSRMELVKQIDSLNRRIIDLESGTTIETMINEGIISSSSFQSNNQSTKHNSSNQNHNDVDDTDSLRTMIYQLQNEVQLKNDLIQSLQQETERNHTKIEQVNKLLDSIRTIHPDMISDLKTKIPFV